MIEKYTEVRVDWGSNVPKPDPGIMQLFIKDGAPVMVDFLCPCGCGNTCPTHLVPPGETKVAGDRRWNYAPGPTLTPSIRWTEGCKAHFNITNGSVVWHADSGK